MSRFKRNIVRRDKAQMLLESAQHSRLLNVENKLIALLKDIPSNSFKATSKTTPEWQTLAYVAQTANLCELWETEITSVEQVMMNNTNIDNFKHRWAIVKQKRPSSIVDFLNLIHECNGSV